MTIYRQYLPITRSVVQPFGTDEKQKTATSLNLSVAAFHLDVPRGCLALLSISKHFLNCLNLPWKHLIHGVQSREGMKFPDFSRLQLNSYVCPRLLRGSRSMLPQKIFEIRTLRLAENEFHTTKFPDFFCF